MLVHVLDLAPLDGSDPVANYRTIEHELELHDPRLAALPRILALSKADLVEAEAAAAAVQQWSSRVGAEVPVVATSSATRQGLEELVTLLMRSIPVLGESDVVDVGALARTDGESLAEHRTYRPVPLGRRYAVERLAEGSFRVTGDAVERLVARYDLDNDEAMAHLERRLRGIGVIRALEAEGFEPGDEVEIAGVEFDLDPGE
jgi:GTP-binding protein